MPSLQHRVVVAYVRLRRHQPPTRDVAEAEQRVLDSRAGERPGPSRGVLRRCVVTTDQAAGFPVHTLAPRGPADGPRVLYLHGGSYTADLQPKHWQFVAALAEGAGATVVLPQYPLAPEAGWRTSWEALLALARGDGDPLVLAGDSAGGGLALALAVALVAEGVAVPALVLDAPWVDLTVGQPEAALAATGDPWLEPQSLRHSGLLWAGGDDPRRPELSPLFADLRGLPRTLQLIGTRDALHPQNVELADRLREAGVPVETVTGEGLLHVFPLLPTPEGRRAVERTCRFLREEPER